jgi:predicted nucleotidyltransferase component of viral defense system
MNKIYKSQVALVLDTLPEIAKEKTLALHGGTAINLFIRNMPRLSVDIDLTYTEILDRESSLNDIIKSLKQIKARLNEIKPDIVTEIQEDNLKLLLSHRQAQIKLEVNQINRGCIADVETKALCRKAQEEFESFCEINVVPYSQLFGGKIIAALDRQHPRDLFDIKFLIDEKGINDAIKPGFMLCLLSSNRPIIELLNPIWKDQKQAFENQFEGMSLERFTYQDFEETRETMILKVRSLLSDMDKKFLLNFKRLDPNWEVFDFEDFPAVKWKMKNLKLFKEKNEAGYNLTVKKLEDHFSL